MAVEQAKITFYKVNQAGFYRWGENENPEFGGAAGILAELQGWSRGKQLAMTKTYEPADGSDLLPVYLMDITTDQNGCLVTMWNQTPATEGKVASAMGNSAVGNTEVVMNDIPEGGIPGFATYFWFMPDAGVFASIRFQHLITGQKPMQEFIESYLGQYSGNVVLTEPDPGVDVELLGYRQSSAHPVRTDVYPRFRTQLMRRAGEYDLLLEQAHRIRKIHRKTTLRLNRPEELAFWQKAYQIATLRRPQNLPDIIKFKYEVKAEMNRDQVQEIINSWLADHDREWDDYGFLLSGEQSPHWLSHSIARDEFPLDVDRNNLEIVNPESLLRAITGGLDEILALIR